MGTLRWTVGARRIAAVSVSGTNRRPIFLLSASSHTGRAGSNRRSASSTSVSKYFCDGCGWPGRSPSSEPLWLANVSRSSTCSPSRASACSSRVLPQLVGPHSTTYSKAGGKVASVSRTQLR